MTTRTKCLACGWGYTTDEPGDGQALGHYLKTGHNDFKRTPSKDICWSCEKRKITIPVMFPESPDPGAPLKRHWWCRECTEVWLDEAEVETVSSSGVVEECAQRGYREEPH